MAGTHGGARPGAGRKPKPAAEVDGRDPLEFLLDVMQGKIDARPEQLKAAVAAAQYVHNKNGEGGKRDAQGKAAEQAAGGKFASATPPRLVVNNR